MTRLKVWTAAKRAHRVADIPLSTAPAPTIAAPIAPALVASPPAIPAASTPAPVKPVPAVPVQVVPDPITAAPVISAPVLPSAVTPAPVKPAEVAPVRVVPSPTAPAPVISAPITPPPVRPAVVSQSIESVVAKQDVAQAGFTLSPAGDDTAKPPAAIEPLEVKQQAEPGPQYRPSLMSRYKTCREGSASCCGRFHLNRARSNCPNSSCSNSNRSCSCRSSGSRSSTSQSCSRHAERRISDCETGCGPNRLYPVASPPRHRKTSRRNRALGGQAES